MSDFQLAAFLHQAKSELDNYLTAALKKQGSDYLNQASPALARLQEASIYATANGGKRMRPALCLATFDALLGTDHAHQKTALAIASALECIHSYSLVHDDLPAMDDDKLRRGQATCHIAYDEATAILVGDGLHSFAFELICQTDLAPAIQIELVKELAQAAGNAGMVGGQAIDLASEDKSISLEELEQLHRLKTGALIQASVRLAAISAGASATQREKLDQFASDIGLAFQVQDDILDIESDTQTLGKQQGADEALNKSTYPKLLGLEGAKAKARHLIDDAQACLNSLALEACALRGIASFIIERQH